MCPSSYLPSLRYVTNFVPHTFALPGCTHTSVVVFEVVTVSTPPEVFPPHLPIPQYIRMLVLIQGNPNLQIFSHHHL